uniref:Putative secreted protein n=1 Tax=Ixodes ricinus TaxID=34613 RepID=A0A6B0U533_IXORI
MQKIFCYAVTRCFWWLRGKASASGSRVGGFDSWLFAERLPCNRGFGWTSKDFQVVENNPQSSAGACQVPFVVLARKAYKILLYYTVVKFSQYLYLLC